VKKHRRNPQYFKEKNYKVKILTRSIFKSKINKIILKKINKKNRKVERKK